MFFTILSSSVLALSTLLGACTGPPPLIPTDSGEQPPPPLTEPGHPAAASYTGQDTSVQIQTLTATGSPQASTQPDPAEPTSHLHATVAIKPHTHSFGALSPSSSQLAAATPAATHQPQALQLIPPPAASSQQGDESRLTLSAKPQSTATAEAAAELTHDAASPAQRFTYTAGPGTQCGVIYPDMREIGTPILRKVLQHQPANILDPSARAIATDTKTMLLNMMSHPTRPIHPLAFFATIKHFESSAHIRSWGWYDFLFFGHLCTSGECSGYFQVDVQIEPDWSLNDICGMDGLDILGLKGGPDFCAALFWWLKGDNGRKCNQLSAGAENPCRSPGYVWDVSVFAQAYRAYGQANQWANYGIHNSWGRAYTGGWVDGEYFMGYENCAAAHYENNLTPASRIRLAVADFAAKINLEPAKVP